MNITKTKKAAYRTEFINASLTRFTKCYSFIVQGSKQSKLIDTFVVLLYKVTSPTTGLAHKIQCTVFSRLADPWKRRRF